MNIKDVSVEEIRKYCLKLSDDPKFKEKVKKADKKELILFLKENGFII